MWAAGYSLPAIADMVLSKDFEDRAERVRDALYRTFPFLPGAPPPTQSLVTYVEAEIPTMRPVGALCASPMPQRPGRFTANARIHAIVIFNLDAVFREYLQERYPVAEPRRGALIRTVERPSQRAELGKISTFYVHGYLKYGRGAGKASSEAADAVAVTERAYYDRFNEPTEMFTYAFLYLLREHPGLFIGLSMRDENLRRLLHYSAKERVQGYEAKRGRYEASRAGGPPFRVDGSPGRSCRGDPGDPFPPEPRRPRHLGPLAGRDPSRLRAPAPSRRVACRVVSLREQSLCGRERAIRPRQ